MTAGTTKTWGQWWRRDFLRCSGSSSDALFGVKIFGSGHFDKRWFKMTVWPAYRMARRIHDAKLWVLYRTTRRDCWTVPTGLRPGYYDVDTLTLRGCMGLLCRYVEDECGGDKELERWTSELQQPGSEGHGPREAVDRQANTQSEAIAIYRWWKVLRPADKKRKNFLMHKLYSNKPLKTKAPDDPKMAAAGYREIVSDELDVDRLAMREEMWALEDKIHKDEQAMLHRLIDIRPGLWT